MLIPIASIASLSDCSSIRFWFRIEVILLEVLFDCISILHRFNCSLKLSPCQDHDPKSINKKKKTSKYNINWHINLLLRFFKCCEVPKTILQTEIKTKPVGAFIKGAAILMLGFCHTTAILQSKARGSLKAGRKQATVIIIFPAPTYAFPKPYPSRWQALTTCLGLRSPCQRLAYTL